MSKRPGEEMVMFAPQPELSQVDVDQAQCDLSSHGSVVACGGADRNNERLIGHVTKSTRPRRLAVAAQMGMVLVALSLCGCTFGLRSAVTVHMARVKTTPRDASVYIDEEFIGPLYYVAAHGVRLPTGKHRISITKDGYFPWDRIVEADRQPISVQVDLVRIPD